MRKKEAAEKEVERVRKVGLEKKFASTAGVNQKANMFGVKIKAKAQAAKESAVKTAEEED